MAISSNGLPTVPIPAIQTWRIPPMATDHAEQQISDENEPFRDRPRTARPSADQRLLTVVLVAEGELGGLLDCPHILTSASGMANTHQCDSMLCWIRGESMRWVLFMRSCAGAPGARMTRLLLAS
jgi:hypothetical protein